MAMDALVDAAAATAQTGLSGPVSVSLSQTSAGAFAFPQDAGTANIPDPCFPQTNGPYAAMDTASLVGATTAAPMPNRQLDFDKDD